MKDKVLPFYSFQVYLFCDENRSDERMARTEEQERDLDTDYSTSVCRRNSDLFASEVLEISLCLFSVIIICSGLNIELRNLLVRYYIWSIALYGLETWTLSKLEKYVESFEIWCWSIILIKYAAY